MEDKISVLISTKNRKEILRQTLDALFHHQDLSHEQFEVIVTNDGSEPLDELIDVFPYKNFRILPNKHKPGAAGARNNGIENAKYNLVIFLDDDIVITPSFLVKVIRVHQQFDEVILGSNRLYPDHLIQSAQKYPFGRYKLKYEYNWLDKNTLIPLNESLYIAQNLASFAVSLKKSTYEKVGAFNEEFKYAGCEDSEFFYRAQKLGIQLLFDESNICYHNELDNFNLKAWLKRQSNGILSAIVICQIHPEGKEHPTWFTNTPIAKNDPFWVKKLKLKKWILSRKFIMQFLFALVWIFEKIHIPDIILFRLYNALWLGSTYKAFRNEYDKIYMRH
ncbi:MAG: glycosyltransferase [Bacteroidales bacterium]